jgi:glycosyltransferase involved in cell wall biosynthesis
MLQTSGDCTIQLCADFQDPLELIPIFVKEWENGSKIISGIKAKSKENKIMRFFRTCYYKIIHKMSDIDQIEHFTGFGLYDKAFVDILRNLHDPTPFLRGIVAELGFSRKDISYTQQRRKSGKTKNNWYTLYDAAMLSFTSYTTVGLRIATILGFSIACFTLIIAFIYFIYKLILWDSFSAGIAPIAIGIFFLGSIQLFFIGFIGEYIIAINKRIMNRPLVIEEERINL